MFEGKALLWAAVTGFAISAFVFQIDHREDMEWWVNLFLSLFFLLWGTWTYTIIVPKKEIPTQIEFARMFEDGSIADESIDRIFVEEQIRKTGFREKSVLVERKSTLWTRPKE